MQRFLGEGGKKRVYLAHDTKLDSEVAFALIKTEGLDAEGLTRVRREAQAMGRLRDHLHIVTVFDIGEEDGQPYIVSQYMTGGDVEGLLHKAENRRLSVDRALSIADQVCQALEHAHGRGIIHRDLKPGNVWLAEDGTAKLGDFGLAVALDRSRLTIAGMMVGTVAYMPPEQALGRSPDARSDLYSLGAMLYEMVAGRPPFLGDDAVAIISQHVNTAPVAPSWHNPDVPRSLEALILRLLAKPPEERPESATTVRQALTAIASTAATMAERVVQEEANPLDRLAGGVFVGRERELDELRAGLEDALSGRGRLLMLVGEPGIGKTRTAEELGTYARLRHAQALWGRCYEGEGAPAYWPWVQVIRSYVHDRDPAALLSEMGPGAADIAQVVSEVRERLPNLTEPPALEPEQARFRLFDSITTFLKNAGNGQPLVLVLDDLHWADKPSLLLLQFLARELRGARVLVVGTYRDVELGRQHPLTQTLGELNREQLSHRILLRGLSERDVARFIEMTAGIQPPEALVAAVYKETEGNPFFVNEIVRLLVSDGRLERPEEVKSWSVAIPQSVREVVGRRLDHLSEACNGVLTIASVIGREFGLDLLERVSDLSGDRLLEALEDAAAARVIAEVPRSPGRYSFTHALIRETLQEELTATRRVRLHRQIAEALEQFYGANPEAHLAELAYHFCEAAQTGGGDVEKAVDYARRAGDRALSVYAHEEACEHYERALQTLELKDSVDDGRRCQLLLALGEAQWRAGEAGRAEEMLWQAADLARSVGAPEQLARAALALGQMWREPGAVAERVSNLLAETADLLGEDDSALRARVLAGRSQTLDYVQAPELKLALSQQAVEMARRVGDRTALADALIARHWALSDPEHFEERLAIADELVRLGEEGGDKEKALQSHIWRIVDLLHTGDVAAADREAQEAVRLTEELRQPLYRWIEVVFRSMRALMEGRFEEAEQTMQQALAVGQWVSRQQAVQIFAVQMFDLRWEQGRLQELEPLFKGFVEGNATVPGFRCALAFLYSELGREEEARLEFEQLAANEFQDLPRDAPWLMSVALLAHVCAFLGDVDRAAILYELLLPYANRNVLVLEAAVCNGSASHYLGVLATAMSRWGDAQRHFEDALAMNRQMGARPLVAHTQHDYAAMLLARGEPGDRERALQLLSEALDTAQALGMKAVVKKALALKLHVQSAAYGDVYSSIHAVATSVQQERPDLRPHAAPDGTVTVLFSDIEGSTALNERLGDQGWMELLRAHNAIVREQVHAHGGFEVKSQGDGFMVAFGSARRALQCAIAIQRALASHDWGGAAGSSDQRPATSDPIKVRIGLHTGEAIKDADDFYGKHVVLASRIAGEARGGQILVSSLLKELTDASGEFTFGEAREVELKGLSGTQQAIPVLWEP